MTFAGVSRLGCGIAGHSGGPWTRGIRSCYWNIFKYSETGGFEEMTYAIVIEKTGTGYSAYVPDLPGCVSVGGNREEMNRNIREAIELYIDELRDRKSVV